MTVSPIRVDTPTITGAAQRYTSKTGRASRSLIQTPSNSWQKQAWQAYDCTPEVRFGSRWIGNGMRMARLYAGRRVDDDIVEPAPDGHRAAELVASIAGGRNGQSELLREFGPHLVVAGEGWIVIRDDKWNVLSVEEVNVRSGDIEVELDGQKVHITDKADASDDAIVIRVWDPHPRRHMDADSPVRPALGLLEELQLLNAAVKAITRSRLTGRGVLLVPKGVKFPTPPGQSDAQDDLIDVFTTVASTAIGDPESAAATVPIILEVPAEAISDIKHLTFESDFDDLAIRLREEAIRRFANGLEIPAEVLLGMAEANHWCTLPHVRIMTRSGWKTYDQIVPGDEVLTLNHNTGLSQWQPLSAVNTWTVEDEPMVRINGRRHSSTTTLNHRWPILSGNGVRVRRWATTQELMDDAQRAGDDIQRYKRLILAAPNADLPAEPKYCDALVELVAWYFTEGRDGKRPGRRTNQINISQSHVVNPDNCARIERALTALFGPESDTFDKGGRYSTPESVARRTEARRLRTENPNMPLAEIGRRLGVSAVMAGKYLTQDAKLRDSVPRWRRTVHREQTRYLLNAAAAEVILDHAPNRVVNLDFVQHLTAAQLELFIDTAVRGDGHKMGGLTDVFSQKDPTRCDAFELACILAGRSVNRYDDTSYGAGAHGPRLKTQNRVTASHRSLTFAPRGRNFEQFTYTGVIWCPTTPNGTWLAEDNGRVFFTGNSAWALQEDAVRLGVEPRLGVVCDALTTQWLHPILESEELPDADEWMVWYDTSPLRVRTNRAQLALEVYDRKELSGVALRRETGFDESDAPTVPATPSAADDDTTDDDTPATAPELPVDVTTGPPTQPATASLNMEGLYAAADGLVWHALHYAGEKLRRTPACPRARRREANQISAAALHTLLPVNRTQIDQWGLLTDAFDRTDEIASRYRADPECLQESLRTYCQELIAAGEYHKYEYLPQVLASCLESSGHG